MRTKAKVVIEVADAAVIGTTVFIGKNAEKEAKDHFVALVIEDMKSQAEANDEEDEFDIEAAREEAEGMKDLNYSSEDDCDIMVVDAEAAKLRPTKKKSS